jgi:hypothetical protein
LEKPGVPGVPRGCRGLALCLREQQSPAGGPWEGAQGEAGGAKTALRMPNPKV